METISVTKLIQQHQTMTAALASHLRTRQADLLDYLDKQLPEMQLAELKIFLAYVLDGKASQTPSELATLTGLHPNTVRDQLYTSQHIRHAREVIARRKTTPGAG
jgi:hypothetical protein